MTEQYFGIWCKDADGSGGWAINSDGGIIYYPSHGVAVASMRGWHSTGGERVIAMIDWNGEPIFEGEIRIIPKEAQ